MRIYLKGLNTCTTRKQKLLQYKEFLLANGHTLVDRPQDCDKILIWTCAFREDVMENSLDRLQYYERNCHGEVFVAGCLPDIAPDLINHRPQGKIINWRNDEALMERFFGTGGKKLADFDPIFVEPKICDDSAKFRRENPGKDAMFHDQFVKLVVAEGCSNECSYCSERFAFPPFSSFPLEALVQAYGRMVDETGVKNVVLLADCLGEYGLDNGGSLPELINRLREVDPETRLALNHLHPVDFLRYFDEFIQFISEGLLIHINLPIQSASDRILKLMNRRYSRAQLDMLYGALNDLGFTEFDTHVIVGFPGETEEDFQATVEFLVKHRVKYAFVSTYMEAPQMPSAKLPEKVDPATCRRRVREADRRFREAGIISSTEGSELVRERLAGINTSI